MDGADKSATVGLGFLTAVKDVENGIFGGYLILNAAGRPLEFHCTAPVRANRTQQILYGPTLEPFLYGELIGRTLVEKATTTVAAIFTDLEPMLCVQPFTCVPVAMVLASGDCVGLGETTIVAGGQHVLIPSGKDADRALIERAVGQSQSTIDLAEPFGRIREALDEARRNSGTRARAA
jgi:hypothetical protein